MSVSVWVRTARVQSKHRGLSFFPDVSKVLKLLHLVLNGMPQSDCECGSRVLFFGAALLSDPLVWSLRCSCSRRQTQRHSFGDNWIAHEHCHPKVQSFDVSSRAIGASANLKALWLISASCLPPDSFYLSDSKDCATQALTTINGLFLLLKSPSA